MTNIRRRIEMELKSHPKAAEKLVTLARHMPRKTESDRIRSAQIALVDYVIEVCNGDARQFLEKYARDEIRPRDIVNYFGRKELGLGLAQAASSVYS